MKKNLEEIATRIVELEDECEKGINISENMEEMTKLLGERVMDRMRLGNSLWVIFNWESYRSRVTGKEY